MRRTLAALALAVVLPLPALVPSAVRAQVVVRAGETLSEIAERHGVGLTRLMQANGITDPDLVVVGQRLVIPGSGGSQRSGGGGRVTVQPGETLSDIAARHGVGLTRLMQANGITNPDLVIVGQRLVIPGSGGGGGSRTARAIPTAPYTVKSGETLSEIADRFGTTTDRLIQINGIANPDLLVAGSRLRIPGKPSAATPRKANPQAREHRVQPGESLSDIADRYGTSVDRLVAINQLEDPDLVFSGMRLKLKAPPAPKATAQPKPKPKPAAQPKPPAPKAAEKPASQPAPKPEPKPAPKPATATTKPDPQPAATPAAQVTASKAQPVTPAKTEPSKSEPAVATRTEVAKKQEATKEPVTSAVTTRESAKPATTPATSKPATEPTRTTASSASAASTAKPAARTPATSRSSGPAQRSSSPVRPASRTTISTASTVTASRSVTKAKAASTAASTTAKSQAGNHDWRSYGPLQVDWANWQSMGGSYVAPTLNGDGQPLYLAINCGARKVNATTQAGQWKTWDSPQTDFEQKLVTDLCKAKGS